ncbi:Hsp70 family protein [Streptosporangiaceae bacterium NEAU-GS5]|nr:Hsp70 family protein [Streptosporangiaceae bacterium NEAU-GS5]
MTAFGIDLGTTNSCIAYIDKEGRPVVVKNANWEYTTPSVLYFDRRETVLIGREAKKAALRAPHLAVQLFKRHMGHEGVEFPFHGERYTPASLAALILKDLAAAAERQLGEPVRDVVITVPAYFGVAEREATRQAGRIAGLNVLDVLDEPVAAALSYQDQTSPEGVRHLLVYDLGGGTFDTTVIRVDGGDVKVICTGGDRDLGGAQWDLRIRDFLINAFVTRHPGLDPTADEKFMQEVWVNAEELKEQLSGVRTRACTLQFAGQTARVEMSRQQLEDLTADLLDRTLDITQATIAKARAKGVPDFDEVLLVGGTTRMPAVEDRLKRLLDRPLRRHEPDLAVARGAALFALIRQVQGGVRRPDISEEHAETIRSRQVTTVLSRGFGVMVLDDRDPRAMTDPVRARKFVVHLLPAGTALPADTGPVSFGTAIDNQPAIEVEVWEQSGPESSEELADNTLIGHGKLRDLPPKLPRGSRIEITFFLSETGLLTVEAREPQSGQQVRFDLKIGGLDQAAVDLARTSVARHDISS